MPTFEITAPDGTKYQVDGPEGATEQDALAQVQARHSHKAQSFDMTADGRMVPTGSPEAIAARSPSAGMSAFDKARAGFGKAFVDLWRGTAQVGYGIADAVTPRQQGLSNLITGKGPVSRVDEARQRVADSRALDADLMKSGFAKAGNIGGNIAAMIPAMAIPGANTVAGAGLLGAGQGLLQPSTSTGETLFNTGLGGALGAGGQKVGQAITGALERRAAAQAATAAQNAPRDAILKSAQEAGYVIPPTAVNGSATATAMESVAGKAAVRQAASAKNAKVTNRLIAEDVGLPGDQPISIDALKGVRKEAGKAYDAVASLPSRPAVPADPLTNTPASEAINPRKLVFDLREARNKAQAWDKNYARTANPRAQASAANARAKASAIQQKLDDYATSMGHPELVPAMVEARTLIAKTYSAQSALKGGNINAAKYAAQLQKDAPLSGNSRIVAQFADAFPEVNALPKSGVGVSKLGAAVAGGGGGMALLTGNPTLAAAAFAAPVASFATRNALLTRGGQALMATPSYATPVSNALLSTAARSARIMGPAGNSLAQLRH